MRVVDDRRAEVIGILFRIAGAPDFRGGSVQPFIHQVDSAFGAFASHPVVDEIRKLRAADPGLSLSAVIGLAPHLTDPITVGERIPLDASGSRAPLQWHGAAARPFLVQARAFARDAHLVDFLRFEQPTFDSASARLERLVASKARMSWFGSFFGESADDFRVSPLLISGQGNFGAEFVDGHLHERNAFVSFQTSDAAGFPVPPADAVEVIVHELNHSFVNHVVIADSAMLSVSARRIFPEVERSMQAIGYGSWLTMYCESLVRAGVIRYLLATEGRAAAQRETRAQQGFGFVWMDGLVELLGMYEANRQQYGTLSSFMPRIAAFYDSLAPRVAQARADFESRRPRVVSASIENQAAEIDPSLGQIVIRFDQAVHGFGNMVGEFGVEVPTITKALFDTTGTVLTIGVRLAPDHPYWLPFGPGSFADADGYPLRAWELRFRTRRQR